MLYCFGKPHFQVSFLGKYYIRRAKNNKNYQFYINSYCTATLAATSIVLLVHCILQLRYPVCFKLGKRTLESQIGN